MGSDPEAIGVGVIVLRGSDVLFGLRRGAHGAGTWSFPGGHLDCGESVEAYALRELAEETELQAANPRRVGETTDVFPGGCATAPPPSASIGLAVCRTRASRRPVSAGVGSPGTPRLSRCSCLSPTCARPGFIRERPVGTRAGEAPV